MTINLNIIEERESKSNSKRKYNEGLHIEVCELDLSAILYDRDIPIMVVNSKALRDLRNMYSYDTTDKKIEKYLNIVMNYLKG